MRSLPRPQSAVLPAPSPHEPLTPRYRRGVVDTSRDVAERVSQILAAMGPVGRAERVVELSTAVRELGLAGVRRRHPNATSHEVLMRYLCLTIGPDAVQDVYGWVDPE